MEHVVPYRLARGLAQAAGSPFCELDRNFDIQGFSRIPATLRPYLTREAQVIGHVDDRYALGIQRLLGKRLVIDQVVGGCDVVLEHSGCVPECLQIGRAERKETAMALSEQSDGKRMSNEKQTFLLDHPDSLRQVVGQ